MTTSACLMIWLRSRRFLADDVVHRRQSAARTGPGRLRRRSKYPRAARRPRRPGAGARARRPDRGTRILPSVGEPETRDQVVAAGSMVDRGTEMPGGHGIGEEVVVDLDVVLVGSDHLRRCARPSRRSRPVLPVAGTVEGHLRSLLVEEGLVVGPSQVVIDRLGDVGDDVLFDLAGADPDPLSVGGLSPVRGHLVTGIGRLPGEEGALPPVLGRLPTCPGETPDSGSRDGPGPGRAGSSSDRA